jgi:hypothetical protein
VTVVSVAVRLNLNPHPLRAEGAAPKVRLVSTTSDSGIIAISTVRCEDSTL